MWFSNGTFGKRRVTVSTLRDGLYWAVVTMTTVGYGDKTPKTTGGRVVAIAWMLSSLVLVSLLSTSLVSRLDGRSASNRHSCAAPDPICGQKSSQPSPGPRARNILTNCI